MPTIEEAAVCFDSEPPAAPTTEQAPTTQSKMPDPKHTFKGHERVVWDLVFLHDNDHIVTGSLDGTMCKWDCDTGLIVGEPWKGDGGEVWAMALSPDGKTIACGRMDGSVQRWDTDGQMIEDVWMGHSGIVRSLSWSPSGNHLASGSQDGTIVIRKVENGEIEVGPIESKQGLVLVVAYSPFGDRIASGGRNNTICVWDKTGKVLLLLTTSEYVASVVWSVDSAKLYCTSDSSAYVFDSYTGQELYCFKHDNPLHSIALSPRHNLLACVGFEGIAQLWDTKSHKPLGQPFSQEGHIIERVSFSRDGRYLAYGGFEGKLTLWVVKDIVPEVPVRAFIHILQRNKLLTAAKSTSVTGTVLSRSQYYCTLEFDRLTKLSQIDATNPCAQSGSDDYGDFFQVSPIVMQWELGPVLMVNIPSLSTPQHHPVPLVDSRARALLQLAASGTSSFPLQQVSPLRCHYAPSAVSLHVTQARSP